MSRREVSSLIDEIARNQKFINEVRKCVNEIKQQTQDNEELPTFAFQKAAKYPWSVTDNNLPIEGQKMIEQITEMMANLIDNNLHHILNRQFLNISNEILVIREEINEFVKEQDKKIMKMKDEFNQNLQTFRKKIVIQQNSNNSKQSLPFSRTRVNASLNTTHSSQFSHTESKESKTQIANIKKEIEAIKNQLQKLQSSNYMSQKLVYLQEKIQNEIVNLRVKIQGSKAKTEKSILDLTQKVTESNNRDFIATEVKRAVKSHIKVYLQEITICKQDRIRLNDLITKTDKGLQDYFANQMKPIWMLLQSLKKRQDKIQNQFNMANQSFILE